MTDQRQADLDALREWDREEHEVVAEWTRPGRTSELGYLLEDVLYVQRFGCDHKGIGRPGCVVCDPRIEDLRAALNAKPAHVPTPDELEQLAIRMGMQQHASGCVDQLVQWTWKWWGVVDTTTGSSEGSMAWLRENVAREA